MTKYHIKADMPETYTSITLTPELEALIEEDAPVRKRPSFLKRVASGALIALMAALPYVAGCGPSNGNNGDAVNPLPAGYNVSSNITPSDGGSVGPDDSPLEVGVDTPAISGECSSDPECSAAAEAGMGVTITGTADNGTADTSDDDTQTIVSHTGVPFGSYTSGDLDLDSFHDGAGLSDGETVTLEATLVATDSDGNPHETRGSVNVVYEEGSVNPVRVTGCYVNNSAVGAGLSIECEADAPNPVDIFGNWTLTGGPTGTTITESGLIRVARALEEGDVNNWTYTVTASDGTYTSNPFTFTIPVDRNRSRVILGCIDGSVHEMLLQESSVDAVATTCGAGFDEANKPDSTGAPDYILDVDPACVTGAIDSLPAAERDAHVHYNDGVLISDVYSTCTVDDAQVEYHHN